MSDREPNLAIVILAAGKGTRMKSNLSKMLHGICGRPMLGYPLEVARSLEPEHLMVVIGRDSDQVLEEFTGRADFVHQEQQRGTGHAVIQAMPKLTGFEGDVLILYGDTPLLLASTLGEMRALKREKSADLVMLSSPEPLPGRVVRGEDGRVLRIVETTDATAEELEIQEGNTGVYLVDARLLREGLDQLDDTNRQGELYLTDIVGFAVDRGRRVEALRLDDPDECLGINTRAELAEAARVMRWRIADALMTNGVTIVDPENTYIDIEVEVGRDCVLEPGSVLTGATVLGSGVRIRTGSVVESSRLGDGVIVGPAALVGAGSQLGEGAVVGHAQAVPANSVVAAGSSLGGVAAAGASRAPATSSGKKRAKKKKAVAKKSARKKGATKKAARKNSATKKAARKNSAKKKAGKAAKKKATKKRAVKKQAAKKKAARKKPVRKKS